MSFRPQASDMITYMTGNLALLIMLTLCFSQLNFADFDSDVDPGCQASYSSTPALAGSS